MRHTTPAITTAILGAVLAASAVEAQQFNLSTGEQLGQSASYVRDSRHESTRKSADDFVYGMTVTRGARYLLRNGLDYLNYKEYERALKFLREAEIRNAELNDAEKLVLTKGIETAKRGIRQAAATEFPYALSERSRDRNGFSPAQSENSVPGWADRSEIPPRKSVLERSSGLTNSAAKNAADHEAPIILASGDVASINASSDNLVPSRSSQRDGKTSVVRHDSAQPRPFPDIPKLSNHSVGINEPAGQVTDFDKDAGLRTEQRSESTSDDSSTVVAVPKQNVPENHGDDLTELAHKHPEETIAAPKLKQFPVISPTLAESSHSATTVNQHREEEQPPLPTKLGREDDVARAPKQTSSPATLPLATITAIPNLTNELPPLPPDISTTADQFHSSPENKTTTTIDDLRPRRSANSAVLPTVPEELSGQQSPSNNTSIAILPADALEAFAATASVNSPDSVITTRDAVSKASSPDSVDSGDKRGLLPHIRTYAEGTMATLPLAQEPSFSMHTSTKMGLQDAKLPAPLLADAKATDLSSYSISPRQNSEPVQQSFKSVDLAVSDLHDDASSLPLPIEDHRTASSTSDTFIPNRATPSSTLRPELKREVEIIVRKQEDELRRRQQVQAQPAPPAHDTLVSDLRAQTQLDISRAPSPAEARPIKAIPVPEDWVPLPPRTWVAQRKYWAAAATCHLPLYFQDPVLERYGHSVEQFVGPIGRYLTYPLDDPTQSTQRNQILQPFFSVGLFAFQIAALPYNILVDPPWEAQYDLGYYRPGDDIPTDTYWLPLHGYGPPFRGTAY